MAVLADRFGAATPQVPHALVNAATAADRSRQRWSRPPAQGADGNGAEPVVVRDAPPLLPLLDGLCHQLAADTFGGGRLTRFDHYRLADWITGQRLPPPRGRDDRAAMVRLLRQWTSQDLQPAVGPAPDATVLVSEPTIRFGLRLLLWAGKLVRVRLLREHVPGLAREARWFMRKQTFLAPKHSKDFIGFAKRLTVDRRGDQNPAQLQEQLKKLLVHAFLQDLRVAYRRRWWIIPRRSGWRRTAYVTVLLDHVAADNGGWELLQLINAVRNETGELDPLLVIAAGAELPPTAAAFTVPALPASQAQQAVDRWRRTLPRQREQLTDDARFVLLEHPAIPSPAITTSTGPAGPPAAGPQGQAAPATPTANGAHAPPAAAWTPWGTEPPFAPFVPPAVPRLAKRGNLERGVALLLLPAMLLAGHGGRRHSTAGCSVIGDWRTSEIAAKPIEIAPGGLQCIGYSDSSRQIFGSNRRLRNTQRAIFDQNAEAKRLHRTNPNRPLVTLVYVAGMTHRDDDPDTDHATAEELGGFLLRQRQQNDKSKSDPLLRIIVANAAAEMAAAPQLVRDLLPPLLRADPTILGVVGFERSVAETEHALAALGLQGIPTVGLTLTGIGLADRSPLYFQLVPDNAQQAQFMVAYAKHLKARRVIVYHPPLTRRDSYIFTLTGALLDRLGEARLAAKDVGWTGAAGELPSLCDQASDQASNPASARASAQAAGRPAGRGRDLVIYVGREGDFGDFLRAITRGCQGQLPWILASDSVSRFVAHAENRDRDQLAGIPVSYVGMGSPVTLAGRTCLSGTPAKVVGGGTPLDAFCTSYAALEGDLKRARGAEEPPDGEAEAAASPWPGERVGLGYDAAGLFLDAVGRLQRRADPAAGPFRPHRAAVAQVFREPAFRFQGATGVLSFNTSRVANTHSLAILRIADIHDLDADPKCAYLSGTPYKPGQPRDSNGCPTAPKG